MEFGMPRRIKPKEKYVRISMKEVLRNLDGPSKNKELLTLQNCMEPYICKGATYVHA